MNSDNSIGNLPPGTQDRSAPCYPSTEAGASVAPAAARAALWGRIPAELRALPHWCITPGTDADKAPRTVTGANASVTDASTWTSFEAAAWAAYQRGGHIGYMLHENDPYGVVDFDVKEHTTQDQMNWFWDLARRFDTFTETSRSGKGLHLWVRGKIGEGIKKGSVEIYSQKRFIITTGNVILDRPIQDRHEWLAWMAERLRGPTTTCGADLIELPAVESDEAVYWKARSHEPKAWPGKFGALWRGEWKQMGYRSQSEADLCFIGMLAAASPSNEQVRRIFCMSGLGQTLGRKGKPRAQLAYLNRTLRGPRAQQADAAQARAGCTFL